MLFFAATTLLLLTACGPDQTVQPELTLPDPDNLWIAGYYYHYTYGYPTSNFRGALVHVREENDRGIPVPGLYVKIDGWKLTYDPSISAYIGSVPGVLSGENLTLTVRSGEDSVSATTTTPFCPTELYLLAFSWNTSKPDIGNTIRWVNPAPRGNEIIVYLFTEIAGFYYLLLYVETEDSDSGNLTIYNHEIHGYSNLTSLTALVCQANRTAFTNNPVGSKFTILAGVWDTWPANPAPGL